jgi:hypothetical protein
MKIFIDNYLKKYDELHKYFEELTERKKKMDFLITISRKVKRQKSYIKLNSTIKRHI